MLILRGLVTFIGGLAVVFLPGAVVSAITRRDLRHGSNLLLWGLGIFLLSFPALFFSSLIRGIFTGGQPPQGLTAWLSALITAAITALFVEFGKQVLLRVRKVPPADLLDGGFLVGLGVGLMFQVALGLSLVGTGLSILFGDTSTPELAKFAAQPWPDLLSGLAAYLAYRLELVSLHCVTGVLVARSLLDSRPRFIWLAIGITATAAFVHEAIGLILGSSILTLNMALVVWEGLITALALRWLRTPPPAEGHTR